MVIPDMRIGALTACAPTLTLGEWMQKAKEIGLDGLEVAAFQSAGLEGGARKDYIASTLDLTDPLTPERARQIIQMSKDLGVAIHSLGSYDNQLLEDKGPVNRAHLIKVIDAASMLCVPYVATFVGADPNKRMQDNYGLFKEHFLPLVGYAKEHNVGIMVENCPMEGWEEGDRPVNQLMSSPRYWNACFEAADKAGVGDSLGLEYDPSHRIWQVAGRMDLVARDIAYFGSRGKIFALHGKGAECLDEGLWMDGIDGKLIDLNGNEWGKRTNYEHAVPGIEYDSVDWGIIIPMARAFGIPFISIEIEDPKYKDMDDPVKSGELGLKAVEIARKNLAPLCYSNAQSYQER